MFFRYSTMVLRVRPVNMLVLGSGLACLVVALFITWFSNHSKPSLMGYLQHQQEMEGSFQYIIKDLNKDNIRNNLKIYTSRQRLPGTEGVRELVKLISKQWRDNGLDKVIVTPYDVLMSYPNTSDPNKVSDGTNMYLAGNYLRCGGSVKGANVRYKCGPIQGLGETVEIVTSSGKPLFTTAFFEKPLDEDGNQSDIIPPYNSFSPAGIAEGDLVYVNYGCIEDFLYLRNSLSIDFTNKIVIARYGKIYRGDKVENAQFFNASGIILYTDPADVNIGKTDNVYPDSWWMPNTGVQRGSIGGDGDYLTPFYPAKDYAHRPDMKKVVHIKIPCQPISYGDALHFLRELGGPDAPGSWHGKLDIRYKIGPGFVDKSLKVKLTVNNYLEIVRVDNIIGIITGSVERDRYVLLGNHHDAWVFGAVDPLSGTAALTEITHVMGKMKQTGVRPRRTIVFCSWGGEEVGLLGSTEFVEEYMKVLYERAVAYINVDMLVTYTDYVIAGTSPLLQDAVYQAAKMVPCPEPKSSYNTLYDIWNAKHPGDGTGEPSVYYSLGSGSDMASFYQRAGVPSADIWYSYDHKKWNMLSYPLYHSAYETFHMYKTHIDPSFNYSLAMTQLWGILSWKLADETLLSFSVRRYATAISGFIKSLTNQFGTEWKQHNVNIDALESASRNLTAAANMFDEFIQTVDKDDILAVRMVNDKSMQLERAFIDPQGLPGRPFYKHVIFAPSKFNSYKDNSFPGIADTMFEIQHNNSSDWDLLKKQVYVATCTIQSAANTLDPIGF